MKYILILLVAIAATSCLSSSEKEAKQRGCDTAQTIIASRSESDMAFQEKLLEVRAEEYKYRSQEQNDEADAYIGGFTEYIIEHNDSLAKELRLLVE